MRPDGVGEGGEVVWAGSQLRAVLFNAKADKLIVTFDHYNKAKTGFPPCEASKLFVERGFANLRLQTARNDWYINDETDALSRAISKVAPGYGFRSCLGYSMGGYASFRFSQAVGAHWVVTVSPQLSLAKSEAPGERRWAEARRGFDPVKGSLRPLSNAALRGAIYFDPMIRQDRHHAHRLHALFPGVTLVPLCFAGHPASQLLADLGQNGVLRQAALDPNADLRAGLFAYRAGRRGLARYWENRYNRLKAIRPAAAQSALAVLATLQSDAAGQSTTNRA